MGLSTQTFGLALLSYSRLYMGLTMFLCLSTGHPDAVGLVTQSSPWDVSHPLLEVHINTEKKSLNVGWGSVWCCRSKNKMGHLLALDRGRVPCSSVVPQGWLAWAIYTLLCSSYTLLNLFFPRSGCLAYPIGLICMVPFQWNVSGLFLVSAV